MKVLIVGLVLAFGVFQCDDVVTCPVESCGEEATVRDLTGKLDGCGWVLELEDGSRVIPERRVYIQAPSKEEDPIYHFTLVDGDRVYVSYDVQEGGVDACMVGRNVFVTCIKHAEELPE
jgi:hypothetical protein